MRGKAGRFLRDHFSVMCVRMIFRAVIAAIRQVLSPPLRRIVLRSLGVTIVLLVVLWLILTRAFGYLLANHPLSTDYPVLDGFVYFMAGTGLVVMLVYLLPAVSALVGGFLLDDAAEIVERTDFPGEPAGQAVPSSTAILYGARFAVLALVVNLAALILFFVPLVNVAAFFAANTYLLGREYFEMAAGRFMPIAEARLLRRRNRTVVLAGGATLAGLMLVPILNLATPVFGIALMVHLHKHVARRALAGPPGR